MKAISLWQPWASAIAAGLKQIETRDWFTSYRGPLAIHAAKRWTWQEREFWAAYVSDPAAVGNRDAFRKIGILKEDDLPLGAIVATCEIYGCSRTEDLILANSVSDLEKEWGNFGAARFGWLLRDIKPLPTPIPVIGRQGFFDWNP